MRVVIAEDDGLIAMFMEEVLRDAGHDIIGAVASSDAAFHLVDAHRPDLLIADIGLSEGECGCELVRKAAAKYGTPSLFVTGAPEKAERCDHAIGVLAKPFDDTDLRDSIEIASAILAGRTVSRIPAQLQLF